MAQIAAVLGTELETSEQNANLARATELELELRCVIGFNITKLRISRGMRQCDLIAGMPTTTTSDSARANAWKIENGRTSMTLHRVAHLAAVLGVHWSALTTMPTDEQDLVVLAELIAEARASRGVSVG